MLKINIKWKIINIKNVNTPIYNIIFKRCIIIFIIAKNKFIIR